MTVNVRSFIYGGAQRRPVTQYQDTFNRGDQPFFLGNNWYMQCSDACLNAPGAMAAGVNVGPSPAFATIGGAPGTIARCNFTPAFVDRAAITTQMLSRGQFSQFTVTGVVPGVTSAVGPSVYNPNPNDGNLYMLALDGPTLNVQLIRGVGSSAVILNPAAMTFAVLDIVRIEVTPQPTQNVVRCIKNGVTELTFNDNAGARPQGGGMYGIAWFSSNVAAISFKDYSGGLL